MRILFTFLGGSGHAEPLFPIAHAADAAGHTVAFGCGPSMVSTVERAGFTVFPLGTASSSAPERLPLRPLDMAREDQEFRDFFARQGAQARTPLTIELCKKWKPDVLVCDEADFGGMVAAEYLGLPHATVLVMAAGSFVRSEVIGEALNELRAQYNLAPDQGIEMLSRDLVLSPFPPGYRDPNFPLPATAHSFRPSAPHIATGNPPAWASVVPGAPVVYCTLGTIFNTESGDLFTRVLDGLRELPINLLMTVGREIDPAEFGRQPEHITIERYIPQALVLPHCDLVVSHGGSGSVAGTLAHGLPSVLIPMGADQPHNAARCAKLGIAQVLDPIAATPASVRDAVTTVLNNPNYRLAAQRFRDEMAALPGPESTVSLLEGLIKG